MFGQWTYLVFLLVWALPIILLQVWFGWPILRRQWRLYLAGVIIPWLWLSISDRLAIGAGVWAISPARSVPVLIFGLPLEELLFFLITNLLIVQGLLLLGSKQSWQRLIALRRRLGL